MVPLSLDRVSILRQAKLFRGLSERELAELGHHALPRRLRRDEPLVFEGESANGLFILAEGCVRLYREGPDGREQVLRTEHAVAVLNELNLFDGGPHAASISATEDSVVLMIHFVHCRQKLIYSPQSVLDALELMAGRLRDAFDLVHTLSLMSVDQRLARFLLEQAQAHSPRGGPLRVRLVISNQQIGAVIGAVREVVSRSLAKLRREGLIGGLGRTIVIPDEARLERFISSNRQDKVGAAAAS